MRRRAWLACGSAAFVLAGCGFALRQPPKLNVQRIALVGFEPRTPLYEELRRQIAEKRVTIELTEAARQWFATNGFDRSFGARPMRRLVQSKLREPLAEEILFGVLQDGGTAKVDVERGEIVIRYEPSDRSARS